MEKKNENAKTSTLMTFEWTEGTAAVASNRISFQPWPHPNGGGIALAAWPLQNSCLWGLWSKL